MDALGVAIGLEGMGGVVVALVVADGEVVPIASSPAGARPHPDSVAPRRARQTNPAKALASARAADLNMHLGFIAISQMSCELSVSLERRKDQRPHRPAREGLLTVLNPELAPTS